METKLADLAQIEGVSKTTIVKRALNEFLLHSEALCKPYQLGVDLFGKYGSSQQDLSQSYKQRLKQKIARKHAH